MRVIVDTDVWLEAFRKRGPKSEYVSELLNLIQEGRIQMIGVIRMERLWRLCSLLLRVDFRFETIFTLILNATQSGALFEILRLKNSPSVLGSMPEKMVF